MWVRKKIALFKLSLTIKILKIPCSLIILVKMSNVKSFSTSDAGFSYLLPLVMCCYTRYTKINHLSFGFFQFCALYLLTWFRMLCFSKLLELLHRVTIYRISHFLNTGHCNLQYNKWVKIVGKGDEILKWNYVQDGEYKTWIGDWQTWTTKTFSSSLRPPHTPTHWSLKSGICQHGFKVMCPSMKMNIVYFYSFSFH